MGSLLPFRPFRKRAPSEHQVAAGRALRGFFEQHAQMVHAICRLELRDRHDAEDATQQTFLAAYRSLLADHQPINPPAWLATIARNECSRVRNRAIVTVPIDDSESAAHGDVTSAVEQREEVQALAKALSELSPAQRDAVVLREFYGLSYEEVSAALGVSGPAVESLLFKGRRRLQEKLSSLRVTGAVLVPDTVRDALVQLVPGFGGGSAAAAVPVAAKVAAVAVVATGGGVALVEQADRDPARPTPRKTTLADNHAEPTAKPDYGAARSVARPVPPLRATERRSFARRAVIQAAAPTKQKGKATESTRSPDASSGAATHDENDEPPEREVEREDERTAVRTREAKSARPEAEDEGPERRDVEHEDAEPAREASDPEDANAQGSVAEDSGLHSDAGDSESDDSGGDESSDD
jgi:RNA polymerase sigma factor (sigma-70 family)